MNLAVERESGRSQALAVAVTSKDVVPIQPTSTLAWMSVAARSTNEDEAYRSRLRGEVFTRRWVVELILDLAGYTADVDLANLRAVEPACGEGAFLGPIVQRLSESCRVRGRSIGDARSSLIASDLLPDNVAVARQVVNGTLRDEGWKHDEIDGLAESWVTHQDFLLCEPDHLATDFVIGNPPYIRPEDVPSSLYQSYRESYPTMCGRADVYVAFIEAALRSLAPNGVMAFICADRWMRNQYGRELRSFVSSNYAMEKVISFHDVDAFEEAVSAYPAIVTIRNAVQGRVVVTDTTRDFGAEDAPSLVRWVAGREKSIAHSHFQGTRLPHWFEGGDSWPGGNPEVIRMVEELNDRLPPIEDSSTGTRVGIGVATGNDGLFITKDPDLVEVNRLLPLAMAADGSSGTLTWSRHYLINPWEADGSLSLLEHYPKLRRYLQTHRAELEERHVAKKATKNWYRTIDKVNAQLTAMPKLLFPDMKMVTHPVLDSGGLYPHHNLYFVVSEKWDLEVLGGLLMSKVAEAFISAYCVKMRGGTLRFQAQYLRRIRVPAPDQLSVSDQEALRQAFRQRNARAATNIAIGIYDVEEYRSILSGV